MARGCANGTALVAFTFFSRSRDVNVTSTFPFGPRKNSSLKSSRDCTPRKTGDLELEKGGPELAPLLERLGSITTSPPARQRLAVGGARPRAVLPLALCNAPGLWRPSFDRREGGRARHVASTAAHRDVRARHEKELRLSLSSSKIWSGLETVLQRQTPSTWLPEGDPPLSTPDLGRLSGPPPRARGGQSCPIARSRSAPET